jgi:hypothetical protein
MNVERAVKGAIKEATCNFKAVKFSKPLQVKKKQLRIEHMEFNLSRGKTYKICYGNEIELTALEARKLAQGLLEKADELDRLLQTEK